MKKEIVEKIAKAVEGLNLIVDSISVRNDKISPIHQLMYLMTLEIVVETLTDVAKIIRDYGKEG